MRGRLSWIGAIPHVVITVLMVVVTVDMLVGVFLRYVMTWVSATFDLPSIRFFWVEEIGEWSLAWMSFIGAALGIRRGIHFAVHLVIDRLLTAAVGIGLFLPPIGVGLLMALRFADVSVGRHFRAHWPYLVSLFVGLLILILFPELTLVLPRHAGMIR